MLEMTATRVRTPSTACDRRDTVTPATSSTPISATSTHVTYMYRLLNGDWNERTSVVISENVTSAAARDSQRVWSHPAAERTITTAAASANSGTPNASERPVTSVGVTPDSPTRPASAAVVVCARSIGALVTAENWISLE